MRTATAHILAVTTIVCFLWLGLSSLSIALVQFEILGIRPSVGHLFLGLAGLRLGLYVRALLKRRAFRRTD